jgi:hypothetical protein
MLQPDRYFPCLSFVEREAIQLVYDSFVPLYFVVPCAPIDDYYAASPYNFDGRQAAFEHMFGVVREDVVIVEGTEAIPCYVGFYDFYLTWLLYDPICCGGTRPDCRQDDYSPVQT